MILSMLGVFLITGWRGHFKNRSSLAHSHSMHHCYALLITGRRDHSEKSEASRRNVRPRKNKRDDESRIKRPTVCGHEPVSNALGPVAGRALRHKQPCPQPA